MATFVVCNRCGRTQEVDHIDQLPETWRRSHSSLICPHCTNTPGESDVLEEEVIYPSTARRDLDEGFDDTVDECFCEICAGPCHGH